MLGRVFSFPAPHQDHAYSVEKCSPNLDMLALYPYSLPLVVTENRTATPFFYKG